MINLSLTSEDQNSFWFVAVGQSWRPICMYGANTMCYGIALCNNGSPRIDTKVFCLILLSKCNGLVLLFLFANTMLSPGDWQEVSSPITCYICNWWLAKAGSMPKGITSVWVGSMAVWGWGCYVYDRTILMNLGPALEKESSWWSLCCSLWIPLRLSCAHENS